MVFSPILSTAQHTHIPDQICAQLLYSMLLSTSVLYVWWCFFALATLVTSLLLSSSSSHYPSLFPFFSALLIFSLTSPYVSSLVAFFRAFLVPVLEVQLRREPQTQCPHYLIPHLKRSGLTSWQHSLLWPTDDASGTVQREMHNQPLDQDDSRDSLVSTHHSSFTR